MIIKAIESSRLAGNRPMDIRFSVFDFETLKMDSLPTELADYTHGLKA